MNILASVEEQEIQTEGYEKKLPPNEDFTNNFNILWLFAARRSWPTLRTSSTSLQTDVCVRWHLGKVFIIYQHFGQQKLLHIGVCQGNLPGILHYLMKTGLTGTGVSVPQ